MNKIISRIFGGLGNQLFIYAAARRLALTNKAELIIDHISGFTHDYQYKRHYQLDHFNIPCRKATPAERLEPFARARRYLKRSWNNRRPFEQRSYIQQEGIHFDPRLLSLRPKGSLYLEGYWQSEDYFKDVEKEIREELQITPPKDEKNLLMAKRIQQELAVAVHVRFFGEPDIADSAGNADINALGDYYEGAIATIDERIPGAHYFVFSDRPEQARANLPLPDSRMTLVHHNQGDVMAYADLWLMTQCKHFIIANSTFSWWGAWLAENSAKVVTVPSFEKQGSKTSLVFRGLSHATCIKC